MADWTLGGGYEYSDILLRDKDGNPITHEDITRFDLDMADGRVQPYHDLSALNAYIVAPSGDDYVVKVQIPPGLGGFAGGFYGVMQIVNSSFWEEYGYDAGSGDRRCILVFTLKKLVEGQTYSYDYLMEEDGE